MFKFPYLIPTYIDGTIILRNLTILTEAFIYIDQAVVIERNPCYLPLENRRNMRL